MLRGVRYFIESILLVAGFAIFRLLPLDAASAIAGFIARLVGPLSGAHETARRNLEMAMPEMNGQERSQILDRMWDNIGRVIGEYPHLSRRKMASRITLEGIEYLEEIRYSEKAVMVVSGHFANWEIGPLAAALYGMPMVLIYRAANNPFSDWVISRIRSHYNRAMYKKGREGAHQAIKALKEGYPVGMLIDQKMNDGKPLQFFGRTAMTATAATTLAIKHQVPLMAARVVRTDGVHFQVTVERPFLYDKATDPETAMQELNNLFEKWIRKNPEQWFWVHRRWGKQ